MASNQETNQSNTNETSDQSGSLKDKITGTLHGLPSLGGVAENLKGGLQSALGSVKGVFTGSKNEIPPGTGLTGQETGNEGPSLSEKVRESTQNVTHGIAGKPEQFSAPAQSDKSANLPEVIHASESSATPESLKTAACEKFEQLSEKVTEKKEGLKGAIGGQADKIIGGVHNLVEGVKNKFAGSEGAQGARQVPEISEQPMPEAVNTENKSWTDKVKEGLQNVTGKITGKSDQTAGSQAQVDKEGFTQVTEGFKPETVAELKVEQAEKLGTQPLKKDNPFEALNSDTAPVQPLNETEIAGGDVQRLTEGITNMEINVRQEVESTGRGILSNLTDKVKGVLGGGDKNEVANP